MADIRELPKISNSAMIRTVQDCIDTSKNKASEHGYTKVFVLMASPDNAIGYECANMDDLERIAFLEMAKNLLIRDCYGHYKKD